MLSNAESIADILVARSCIFSQHGWTSGLAAEGIKSGV